MLSQWEITSHHEISELTYLEYLTLSSCFLICFWKFHILVFISLGNLLILSLKPSLSICPKGLQPKWMVLWAACLTSPVIPCVKWESLHRQVSSPAALSHPLLWWTQSAWEGTFWFSLYWHKCFFMASYHVGHFLSYAGICNSTVKVATVGRNHALSYSLTVLLHTGQSWHPF